jgi:hypothetical protein
MKTLRVHDPGHRPPDWAGRLSATQVAVFLRDVKREIELDLEGNPFRKGSASVVYVFDSLIEAEEFCRQKVEEIDHLLCEIYDGRGKLIDPIRTFISPAHAHRVPNRRSAMRMIAMAWLLIAISPVLFWIDYRRDGVLIVPTVVGFACIVTAMRLLYWGHGDLARVRDSESPAKL